VDNTFVFPDIEDGSICKASLSHLRQLYASEKDNYIKMAPGLSYKALNPSNLERQNVKLVLKVFDEKTITAWAHLATPRAQTPLVHQNFSNLFCVFGKF